MIGGRTVFDEAPETAAGGLRQYLEIIGRRKWIVGGITVLAVAAAALFSFAQPKVYRAEMEVLIGLNEGLVPVDNASAIQPYTATMRDIFYSNVVAEQVIDNLDLDEEPDELLNDLAVAIDPETAVLDVSFEDTDPQRAQQVLQEFGLVFQNFVAREFRNARLPDAGQPGGGRPTARITDPAHVLADAVSPKPLQNIILAAILGFILGLVAAFLREHFDRGLREREEVERAFGVAVIGQIPFQRTKGRDERSVVWDGFGEIAEAYRGLRANLQYLSVRRPLRTILVTSPSPQQGKTTVTANLAVAIARSGATTVALEGDLRRPRLDEAFGQSGEGPGLTSVLVGTSDLGDAMRDVPAPAGEGGDGSVAGGRSWGRLSFMPSGPLPPNPSELLSSTQMTKLLDRLAVDYDYVLIDSPPVLLVSDALELARNVDGVVLVVRREHANRDEAREVRALIERLGIQLVGVVFTDVEPLGTYGTYGESAAEDASRERRKRRRGRPERDREREDDNLWDDDEPEHAGDAEPVATEEV